MGDFTLTVGTRPDGREVRRIAAEEAAIAGIDPAFVFARDRRGAVTWVRARIIKRLHATGLHSTTGIGIAIGVDHSSVIWAIHRELSEKPPRLRALRLTPEDRFLRCTTPVNGNDCQLWKGYLDHHGYGIIVCRNTRFLAHRFSYERTNGPITDGLLVCHKCDVPACVNPAHLFLGTQKDNMSDCARKGRIGTWKTAGLDFSGEKNGNSKLTEKIVAQIKATPGYQRDVAKAFGISQAQVWNIRKGLQWAHVEPAILAPPLSRLMAGRA